MAIQAEVLEAQVRVEVDKALRDLNKFDRRTQQTVSKTNSAGKSMRLAFAGIGVGAAATGAFRFLKGTADSASDLNETMSMSAVIFGRQQKAMERWASGAWKSVGLGKRAALDAAAGFGDMFAQLGYTQREAARMSRTVVQMSADLGSFKNLKTAEVTDMISAAFRGEYDSLQRVIPNINAARVETEALAQTGKKAAKELTAQEKATATLAIIQKDGRRAAGDFARTSGGAANQQKILQAQIENTKDKIGQGLLPAYRDFWKFSNDRVLPAVNNLIDGMKDGTGTGGELVKVWKGEIVPTLKDLASAGEDMLPFLKGAASLGREVLDVFGDLPQPLRQNILYLGGLTLAMSKLNQSRAMTGLTNLSTELGTVEGRAAKGTKALQAFGGMARNVAGAGGLMLMADAAKRGSSSLGVLESAAGGAMSGAALGAFAGPWGAAIGGVLGGAGGAFLALGRDVKQSAVDVNGAKAIWDGYKDTLEGVFAAATKATRVRAIENLAKPENVALVKASGENTRVWTNAIMGNAHAQGIITKAIQNKKNALTQEVAAQNAAVGAAEAAVAASEKMPRGQDRVRAKNIATQQLAAAKEELRLAQDRQAAYNVIAGQQADLMFSMKGQSAEQRRQNALAMTYKDLIKLGVPKKVAGFIDRRGVAQDTTAVAGLIEKFNVVGRGKWKAILTAAGIEPTDQALRDVQTKLDALKRGAKVPVKPEAAGASSLLSGLIGGLQAQANRNPIRVPMSPANRAAGGTIYPLAGGGTVAGARRPYGDKVLTYLAPGEEVISNDRGQADRARGLLKLINANRFAKGGTVKPTKAQKKAQAANRGLYSDLSGAGLASAIREGFQPTHKALYDMWRAIMKQTSGAKEKRLLKVLDNNGRDLKNLARRREAVDRKLTAAITKRDALIAARDDFRSNVREGIASQANVLNSGNSASEIAKNLGTQAGKAREFAAMIQTLRKRGYSSAVIQQVAAAGIEGGLEVGRALAAGSSADVSSINRNFGAITKVADQQGKLLADQFYNAGINSAQGVVKGLQSQKKEIEAAMFIIARGMMKALRKALGIKSPAKLPRREMAHVGRGLLLGLRDQEGVVTKGAQALSGALMGGLHVSGKSLTPASTNGAGITTGGVHFTFNTWYPINEPQSQTQNKALARVAALGLA